MNLESVGMNMNTNIIQFNSYRFEYSPFAFASITRKIDQQQSTLNEYTAFDEQNEFFHFCTKIQIVSLGNKKASLNLNR